MLTTTHRSGHLRRLVEGAGGGDRNVAGLPQDAPRYVGAELFAGDNLALGSGEALDRWAMLSRHVAPRFPHAWSASGHADRTREVAKTSGDLNRPFQGISCAHDRECMALTLVNQGNAAITSVKSLAERVTEARKALGWSQAELAEQAGVSTGTIGNIESGTRKQPRQLFEIARALGKDPEWLLTGKTNSRAAAEEPRQPDRNFKDRREVSDSDFATLQAVKVAMTETERSQLHERYDELMRQAREQLEQIKVK